MNNHLGLTPGRLYDLVCAVAEEEITVREFHSALNALPSETIQYLGTVLALQSVLRERPSRRMAVAGALCRAGAIQRRSLN